MDKARSETKDGWLKILYQEAWKQYCHEDNLGLARTSLFVTIHAVLLALVGGVAKPLIETAPHRFASGRDLQIGYAVLGVVMLAVGLFLFSLTFPWKSVIVAGRRYLNLRWIPIAVIEELVGVYQGSIALLENKWRTFSAANPGEPFFPYAEHEHKELGWLRLDPLPRTRGWGALESIITAIRFVDGLVGFVGILLLALTYYVWIHSGSSAGPPRPAP